MAKAFELKLLDQYWISGSRDPEGEPEDATSHGRIALVIDGEDISGCEDQDTDYGINQSAVALLQSIFIDHVAMEWPSYGPSPVFFHGCSILATCPNCIIDFDVRHLPADKVSLTHFHVSGGPRDSDPRRFHDRAVCLFNLDYARIALEFAARAFEFLPAKKGLDYEVRFYQMLRSEHEVLMSLAGGYLRDRSISEGMRSRALGFDPTTFGPRK